MTPHEYYIDRKIPEYYPTMYLDGYLPEQILAAKHRQMLKELTDDDIMRIVITSEVKTK